MGRESEHQEIFELAVTSNHVGLGKICVSMNWLLQACGHLG